MSVEVTSSACPVRPHRAGFTAFVTLHRKAILRVVQDGLLPFASYVALRHVLPELQALAATAALPAFGLLGTFLRHGRVDLLRSVVLVWITFSLGLAFWLRDPRVLLLKGPLGMAVVGIVCLASVAIRRPIAGPVMMLLSTNLQLSGLSEMMGEQASAGFRITLLWGFGLLSEASLRMALLHALPTTTYLAVAPLTQNLFYPAIGACSALILRRTAKAQTGE